MNRALMLRQILYAVIGGAAGMLTGWFTVSVTRSITPGSHIGDALVFYGIGGASAAIGLLIAGLEDQRQRRWRLLEIAALVLLVIGLFHYMIITTARIEEASCATLLHRQDREAQRNEL